MFNEQLDMNSPNHLRHDPMVAAWIADYQRDKWNQHPDCKLCGWPHATVLMCGMGSTFGQVKIGRQYVYVDTSNVASLRKFREELGATGFHWRDDVYVARSADAVVINRIEYFNGHPHVEKWVIPVNEFASIVCAASVGGETGERYQQALAFLTQPVGSAPAPDSERVEKLAKSFAMEFLTGHYRGLREDEQKRYEQLVVVMLAFASLVKQPAGSAPTASPQEKP
jgi:hypothetical protein